MYEVISLVLESLPISIRNSPHFPWLTTGEIIQRGFKKYHLFEIQGFGRKTKAWKRDKVQSGWVTLNSTKTSFKKLQIHHMQKTSSIELSRMISPYLFFFSFTVTMSDDMFDALINAESDLIDAGYYEGLSLGKECGLRLCSFSHSSSMSL